ncbi:hypothetical protein [Bosea sp. BIWAKO-01]|uniref:hypothetical protein n=1 Tax=Bosea sp. BIWAKO-01 TaxID=506668 RepID=UPI000852C9B9|nr:hypothetical protein [Bosea sp. BIWAKO-01]GAU81465.1 hypothetical protein BIWAKO_01359 [Bosea sp. BIWAKO-01]
MFDLLRARPARKAAYSVLEPFVLKTSANGAGLQAGDWLQPQILGFLATVVTLIVERRCGELQTHALASVQSSVLNALTGIGPELVGEEICLLSSRRDPAFTAGSTGALAFLEALDAARPAAGELVVMEPLDANSSVSGRRTLDELWHDHVERHMRQGQFLT